MIQNSVDKMPFLKRQIRFVCSIKRKLLVGLILCAYLNFIIIFLQPFDTSQFEADNKFWLLSGYGILLFAVFVIQGMLENTLYFRLGKIWRFYHEILATLFFCFFSGTLLYMYNRSVVNDIGYEFHTYWIFLSTTVVYMIPVFVPPMLYLRQKLGEHIIPVSDNSIRLAGENKNEILSLEKDELLFVKAVENYVEICFINKDKKVVAKTFRQTLSNIYQQLPFLQKCHRSYLVNTGMIKEIIGNSQSAKISFIQSEKEIPLSKSYYRHIKNSIS